MASAETCGFFFATVEKNVKKKKCSRNLTTAEAICVATKESEVIELNQVGKGFCTEIFLVWTFNEF